MRDHRMQGVVSMPSHCFSDPCRVQKTLAYGMRMNPWAVPVASKYSPVMTPAGLMTEGKVLVEFGTSMGATIVPSGDLTKP